MNILKTKHSIKKHRSLNNIKPNYLNLLIKAVDEIENKKTFPGWEYIVYSIFHKENNKSMCMNEIMKELHILYPMWSKKGPNGGNTIRNTLSSVCCNFFNNKKMIITYKDKKLGRFYCFSENVII